MDSIKKDNRIEYRVYEYGGESFLVNTYEEALSYWKQGRIVHENHIALCRIDEWTVVETIIQREWR
jgi:hypothetical protein